MMTDGLLDPYTEKPMGYFAEQCAIKELKLSAEKVNVYGGACVLGHPLGDTGARIIVTILNALKQIKLKRGLAALCIGGGEATAVVVEIIPD